MALIKRKQDQIPEVIGTDLARIFGLSYETEVIELNNGLHEIEIPVEGRPDRVWVSFDDIIGDLPVCGGNVDKIGVSEKSGTFVIYADIQSTKRVIRWFVSITPEKDLNKE